MKDFNIKVTPEESKIVQKLLFLVGSRWAGTMNTKDVGHTDKPYLYHSYKILTYSDGYDPDYFHRHSLNEITFKEFIDEIEYELSNK